VNEDSIDKLLVEFKNALTISDSIKLDALLKNDKVTWTTVLNTLPEVEDSEEFNDMGGIYMNA
jgi:hypothetical protein